MFLTLYPRSSLRRCPCQGIADRGGCSSAEGDSLPPLKALEKRSSQCSAQQPHSADECTSCARHLDDPSGAVRWRSPEPTRTDRLTLNQRVEGSSPSTPTNEINNIGTERSDLAQPGGNPGVIEKPLRRAIPPYHLDEAVHPPTHCAHRNTRETMSNGESLARPLARVDLAAHSVRRMVVRGN